MSSPMQLLNKGNVEIVRLELMKLTSAQNLICEILLRDIDVCRARRDERRLGTSRVLWRIILLHLYPSVKPIHIMLYIGLK